MTTAALIVAGGSGTRTGSALPKQYHDIGGVPVIARTIAALSANSAVNHIQVVIANAHADMYANATLGLDLPPPVTGGNTRQQSVFNGLRALAPSNPDKVLIHDAARPFVSQDLIDRVIGALDDRPAVIPGIAVTDTLKRASDNVINETVSRDGLWAVQTPQGFLFDEILQAHETAASQGRADFTDDAALAEWRGHSVTIVEGDRLNTKLTTAEDMAEAHSKFIQASYLERPEVRTGSGYDVHAFEPGDHVILCGIKIPHDAKLKGHSDADVAMHALTDAILGAISEGDIGAHFPPTDPEWKAADSAIFLTGAAELVKNKNGIISHCDVTVICESPKLRPHIDAMRLRLGEILSVGPSRISVKATTSEQLGFTGRREGIAALATATVRLPVQTD